MSEITNILSPSELCFDKNDFMRTSFFVDEFLHKNRNAALEHLRDNLGVYLKVLRSSMIDLINEDYADFVSLSANLVGLDQSIDVIQKPLQNFREEIFGIKQLINDNENEIKEHLNQKNSLRIFQRNLNSLKRVYSSITILDNLLSTKLSSDDITPFDLERAALDLVQLKYNMKFCQEFLDNKQNERINSLNDEILRKLRIVFNKSLVTSSSVATDNLERCLRIYITLDACDIAEKVFKEDVVAPYMIDTISEQCLQNSPQGLAGIYSKTLSFVSLHMTDLLRITQYTDKLKGFNFLTNSFWQDVESRLENHMSSIFAPGNCDMFYVKYKCTRDFLSKIEEILADEIAIREFRYHPQTKSFHARWNLPVYFQICFQEIAGQLEANFEPVLSDDKIVRPKNSNEFAFSQFMLGCQSIERCWSDGVYLHEVFPKFWKLTIQIIQRLSKWITDALKANRNKIIVLTIPQLELLILLHADIKTFIGKLPAILNLALVNFTVRDNENADILSQSIVDIKQSFEIHLNKIEKYLMEILITESIEFIRNVNDIPRLYRKTNREKPSKSSSYLEQMMKPIRNFQHDFKEKLDETIIKNILFKVYSSVTEQYYKTVTDVLSSVQKTEESLRRLRNLKEKSYPPTQQMSSNTSGDHLMSDDDKIRLQLRVDVASWTKEITKANFTPGDIEKLLELNNAVEEKS